MESASKNTKFSTLKAFVDPLSFCNLSRFPITSLILEKKVQRSLSALCQKMFLLEVFLVVECEVLMVDVRSKTANLGCYLI